ncbi:hypothetical protein [Salinirubrum litoreum]|uniref:Holin-X, holin superfamily III n=1 Tax=Salinirubrum litoreum TaxID=1126234 RepID=A0ABD5RF15_9EURY|nr:hypothetical protein [Salinirubrum litoreum]
MDRYAVKRGAVTLLRVALFAVALFAVAGVAAVLLGFLGFVTVLGTASALLDAGTAPLLLVGGAGVLGLTFAGVIAYALLRVARRVDSELLDAAGPLDRLSALQERYVRDEVDEHEFEDELAALLDDDRVPEKYTVPRYDEAEWTQADGVSAEEATDEHRDESAEAREVVREQ